MNHADVGKGLAFAAQIANYGAGAVDDPTLANVLRGAHAALSLAASIAARGEDPVTEIRRIASAYEPLKRTEEAWEAKLHQRFGDTQPPGPPDEDT